MSKEYYIVTTNKGPEKPTLENIFLTREEAFQAALQDLFDMASLCWDELEDYYISNKIVCDDEMTFIECEDEGIEYKYYVSAVTFANEEDEPEFEEDSEYLHFSKEKDFEKWVMDSLKKMNVGKKAVNKLYPYPFVFGFYDGDGEFPGEGVTLLEAMGLDPSQLPFDAEDFLKTGKAEWTDKFGGKVKIDFSLNGFEITSNVSYNGKETGDEFDHSEEYCDWDELKPAQKQRCLSTDIGRDIMRGLVEVFDWEKHPHPNHEVWD